MKYTKVIVTLSPGGNIDIHFRNPLGKDYYWERISGRSSDRKIRRVLWRADKMRLKLNARDEQIRERVKRVRNGK